MLTVKRYNELFSHARAGTATYWDADGILRTAPADTPRFDYDPATRQPRGLLIEESRSNLCLWSEDFTNVAWVKSGPSVVAQAALAPNGNLTASKLVESTNTGSHILQQSITGITSGQTYGMSVFAKAGERTRFNLFLNSAAFNAGGNITATFDVSAGKVTNVANQTASTFWSITPVGNGWYRCILGAAAIAAGSAILRLYLADASGNPVYQGDGVSGLYFWGAQLERGPFATSYIPTTSAPATRPADVVTATLGSWFPQSDGATVLCEIMQEGITSGNLSRIWQISDGRSSNAIELYHGSYTALQVANSGTNTNVIVNSSTGATNTNAGAIWRNAVAVAPGDQAIASNNGAGVTAQGTLAVASLPGNLSTLRLGNRVDNDCPANIWLRDFQVVPRRMSNVELAQYALAA